MSAKKPKPPPPPPSLETTLLEPPGPFHRSQPKRPLLGMYSVKVGRWVQCQGQPEFALAVWLEVDVNVATYNEQPRELDVNTIEGKSRLVRPAAASKGNDKSAPTLHVIDKGDSPLDWEAWCTSHDCLLKRWSLESLQIGSMLMANRERLLRYASHLGLKPDLGLQDHIAGELRSFKAMTVYGLMNRIFGHSEEAVLAAIAALVLRGRIVADLSLEEFDLTCELKVAQ
jgi:hypothetical protein